MQHLRLGEGIGTRSCGELENFRQPGSFAQKTLTGLTTEDTEGTEELLLFHSSPSGKANLGVGAQDTQLDITNSKELGIALQQELRK